MQFFLLLFIVIPIIEIAVFIQVGDILGLAATLLIVFVTAIVGVNLLKQQGLRAWSDIQLSMAQGQVPALEMASAAQLLFAGGLLLTPGFVTDMVGFALMVPAIRFAIARQMMQRWSVKTSGFSQYTNYHTDPESGAVNRPVNVRSRPGDKGRTIEGEFEEQSK